MYPTFSYTEILLGRPDSCGNRTYGQFVRVHLTFKKGLKVSRKIATSIAEGISRSVALSVEMRTSNRWHGVWSSLSGEGPRSRASSGEKTRYNKTKELEEMS
jgi:hypothetical protein